jgi:LppP/LprE lipoprotein
MATDRAQWPRIDARRLASRVIGVLATAALLGVGAASVAMVLAAVDGEEETPTARPSAAAAPRATPTPTPTPKPRRPRLTAAQRAARVAAAGEVRRQGFEPVRLADWRPRQTLRVLIGRESGGTDRRAFFFVGRRYVGNDAPVPSARVRVGSQRRRRITLVYSLYEQGDRACCPHGGTARVSFGWDGASLRPLDAVPPPPARTAAG